MQCDAPRHCHRTETKKHKKQLKISLRATCERGNANTPRSGVPTCLSTSRDPIFTGRVAGDADRSWKPIKSTGEKSVARAFAEWVRGGPSLDLYSGSNARATPPRSDPREEQGVSSKSY